MKHTQLWMFLAVVAVLTAFIWLANESREWVAKCEGYTVSEVQAHNKLVAKSVMHVVKAERNREKLVSLYEPDGSPEEVVLYRKGSAVNDEPRRPAPFMMPMGVR